jgi:hypothetical protein
VEGKAQVRGAPSRAIAVAELAKMTSGFGAAHPPVFGVASQAITHRAPAFGAHAARVRVDADSGRVQVTEYAVAQDVGRAINPAAVRAQIHGGVAQGIGWALFEQMTYDDAGTLHHVGVTSSFTRDERRRLVDELAPLRTDALDGHPWSGWKAWEEEAAARGQRLPGATSRWNRGRDLSWEALRVERVCEVAYDHLQGDRFRHATTFLRWRPDRSPRDCRYDQLQATAPYELGEVFGRG